MKFFYHFVSRILDHKNFMDYSKRKIRKICVNLLWSLFELENVFVIPPKELGTFLRSQRTSMNNFGYSILGISNHRKYMDYSIRKSIRSALTYFRARLKFKMS